MIRVGHSFASSYPLCCLCFFLVFPSPLPCHPLPPFFFQLLTPRGKKKKKKKKEGAFATNKESVGVPVVAQQKQIWLTSMRTQVRSLASLSGLRIQCCHELWCSSQMWLRSGMAVAVASGYSSDPTPGLGISICRGCGPKIHKTINSDPCT